MAYLSKSQFLALKFDRFEALAAALEARAQEREQEADDMTRNVENPQGTGEFTGAAGDAARAKCEVIVGSMKKQSSTDQDGASAVRGAGPLLQSHKDAVVGMLDDIEQHRPFAITYKGIHKDFGHAKVGEDWKVVPPPVQIPGVPQDVVQAAIDALLKIDQDDLDAKLKAFADEDAAQAQKITDVTAFDQIASGDPLIGETPDQARQEAKDAFDGDATDEERARVVAATNLDDAQAAALANGEPVALGTEAWAVVYQMQRAMDGKSPDEIKAALDRLPPDQKAAFQKALQLASNPKVGSGLMPSPEGRGVKSTFPQQGGEAVLPDKIKAALDRQHVEQVTTQDHHANAAPAISLNGMDDINAIADIVKGTPAGFQQGSDLDRGLMKATADYLHAYETSAHSRDPYVMLVTRDDHPGFLRSINPFYEVDAGKVDPKLENMISVAGQDHIVDRDMMADGAKGQQFINDVLKHPWQDKGAAASSLFNWEGGQSHVGPGVSDKQAELAGSSMAAVAKYMDEHQGDLLKFQPGDRHGNMSLGQLNPDLTRTLASSLSPYWTDMANGHDPGTRGFHLDQSDDMLKSAHIAAVLNSDPTASATFNKAGIEAAVKLNQEVGQSLVNGDPHTVDKMGVAGRISGIIDKGLMDESHARGLNDYDAAKAAYDAKTAAWKAAEDAMKVGEMVPVGGKIAKVGFDEAKDALKHWLVGDAPVMPKDGPSHYQYQRSVPMPVEQEYQIVAAMQACYSDGHIPDADILKDPRFTDGEGHLRPYDQIPKDDHDELERRLMNWLNQQKIGANGSAGMSVVEGFESFDKKYNKVIPPSKQQ